jgi:hypothetical protein
VDLQSWSCSLELYANGSVTATSSFNLSGTLASHDVLVVCNSALTDTQCDQVTPSAVMSFNGDDALQLVCNGVTVDVFGQIGLDPGTGWGSGSVTADHTLRRKCAISGGDSNGSDVFDPLLEWEVFARCRSWIALQLIVHQRQS